MVSRHVALVKLSKVNAEGSEECVGAGDRLGSVNETDIKANALKNEVIHHGISHIRGIFGLQAHLIILGNDLTVGFGSHQLKGVADHILSLGFNGGKNGKE